VLQSITLPRLPQQQGLSYACIFSPYIPGKSMGASGYAPILTRERRESTLLLKARIEKSFPAVPPFITCSAGATALALIHHEQESDSAAAERGP
jgi:hypothetical protein